MDRTEPMLKGGTFTEVLSLMPETYLDLLALHLPDEKGRCRACTAPGTGVPHDPWPCAVHDVAARADRIARARERGQQQRRERAG